MELKYRKYGKGPALIILHGLYGASDNWISIGRELAKDFEVFIPDQRNHGDSPHTEDHNYAVMKEDLREFMDQHSINKATILGHSMGGKTAIFFALEYPEKVENLIVVDISPRAYHSTGEPSPHSVDHEDIIEAMQDVDLSKAENRMDIDMMLASTVKSQRIRQFLLKNIKRKDQETFSWKINLDTLKRSLPQIMDGVDNTNENDLHLPVLFIKGENSDYISDPDFPLINKIFPDAKIVSIPNAGHWLHAEQPELFIKNVRYFLSV